MRKRIGLWVVLTLLLSMGGCSLFKPQAPSVTLVGLRMIDASLFEQRFAFRLRVQNPNDFEIPLRGMSFELHLNDQPFAKGVSDRPATLPRLGETVLEVTAVSDLLGIFRQLAELQTRNQTSVSYVIKGRIVNDVIPDLTFENRGLIEMPIGPGGK